MDPDDPLRPRDDSMNAAAAEVPAILRDCHDHDPYLPVANPDPKATCIAANDLILLLVQKGHNVFAATWGVLELGKRGFLSQETARVYYPETTWRARNKGWIPNFERWPYRATKPGPLYYPRSKTPAGCDTSKPEPGVYYRENVYPVIWATEGLWDWWKLSPGAKLRLPENDIGATETTPRKKGTGGRNKEREDLWKLTQKMKATKPAVTDKQIAAKYNQIYARSIADNKRAKATARSVSDVRYERTKRKRKQKH
ncbi:MAG: hypothetical protein NTY19_03530 [Planctomycetota bacterium]|nr:hypothetical protein [Planctomycetota bacterium]